MQIKLLARLAGPDENLAPGQIVEKTAEEAAALVDGGYAMYLDDPLKEPKRKLGKRGTETAMVGGGEKRG